MLVNAELSEGKSKYDNAEFNEIQLYLSPVTEETSVKEGTFFNIFAGKALKISTFENGKNTSNKKMLNFVRIPNIV